MECWHHMKNYKTVEGQLRILFFMLLQVIDIIATDVLYNNYIRYKDM